MFHRRDSLVYYTSLSEYIYIIQYIRPSTSYIHTKWMNETLMFMSWSMAKKASKNQDNVFWISIALILKNPSQMRRKTTKYYETMFMAWLETEMDLKIHRNRQQQRLSNHRSEWIIKNAVLLLQASIWAPACDEELDFHLQAVVNFYLYIFVK